MNPDIANLLALVLTSSGVSASTTGIIVLGIGALLLIMSGIAAQAAVYMPKVTDSSTVWYKLFYFIISDIAAGNRGNAANAPVTTKD